VTSIREQGERAGQEAGDELDRDERRGEQERDEQGSPVANRTQFGCRPVVVPVPMSVAMAQPHYAFPSTTVGGGAMTSSQK
jgi:hypothetical protein